MALSEADLQRARELAAAAPPPGAELLARLRAIRWAPSRCRSSTRRSRSKTRAVPPMLRDDSRDLPGARTGPSPEASAAVSTRDREAAGPRQPNSRCRAGTRRRVGTDPAREHLGGRQARSGRRVQPRLQAC